MDTTSWRPQVALDTALRSDPRFMKVAGSNLLPVPERPYLIGEGADARPFQRCARTSDRVGRDRRCGMGERSWSRRTDAKGDGLGPFRAVITLNGILY